MPRDNKLRTVSIDYTNRDISSLREDLENYAKNYYSDINEDYSENSFLSLMMDTVSYIGDNLSFYLDYQANEGSLDTATELENIINIGKMHGYKYRNSSSGFGEQSFYAIIPAKTIGDGPNPDYFPVLKQGTEISSNTGGIYSLTEDIHFQNDGKVVVAEIDSTTGNPTSFAVKAKGQVISGELRLKQISVGSYERFLKVEFEDDEFVDIVSVFDGNGNEYYEVESLTQQIVYKSIPNRTKSNDEPNSLLIPLTVPRRFVSDFNGDAISLQFGSGKTGLNSEDRFLEPNKVFLQKHGKEYISDLTFDPTNLVSTGDMGIVPVNTTLYITYRASTDSSTNAAVKTVTRVSSPLVEFENREDLDESVILDVINSLETENESPIVGDVIEVDEEEIRQRIYGFYSAQKRGVTKEDYVTLCYAMPGKFGGIKRANVITDPNNKKRNLNLYVLSEDSEGNLITTNNVIKENLKTWIGQYKMINDTIDILNAKIVNLEIEFVALSELGSNKYDILRKANAILEQKYTRKQNIGEPFFITDVYKELREVDGLLDVVDVNIRVKNGTFYSTSYVDLDSLLSSDKRYYNCPKNVVFEIKFPDSDIKGIIK